MVAKRKYTVLDKVLFVATRWIGTPASIVMHTVIFLIALGLIFFGVNPDRVMLILTTAVSLEAIYLTLFIQMTVNRHERKIRDVHDDVEEIQVDVGEIQEDIEDLKEEEKQSS